MDGTKRDGEDRVNTTTANIQALPVVTMLQDLENVDDDGGWVVVWYSLAQDGNQGGIYQQRYNADGTKRGGEVLVNTTTNGHQSSPAVTWLKDGGWVVTWTSPDGSGDGIYQQRYDRSGIAWDGEQLVNMTLPGSQIGQSITALDNGGWVITWTSENGGAWDIYQRVYGADGRPQGGEVRVNTEGMFSSIPPEVTLLDDGGWLVTWTVFGRDGVYHQRFNADGSPLGTEVRVDAPRASDRISLDVAALSDGGWVATWVSVTDGSGYDIHQQRYSAVAAFGEGQEFGSGSAGRDVFQVLNGGLTAGDSLDGGGVDVLAMAESGTLDLTAPDRLSSIEIVQGTGGSDIVITNVARSSEIVGFAGGAGADDLRLIAGSYDFSMKFVSGFEAITLLGTGSITFGDKATALLAHSQTQDGTLTLTGDSFSLAERTKLYEQGIRHVTDSGGAHVLQPAEASLSKPTVQENAGKNTVVGTLSGIDPNPDDGLSFQLIDNAGGRFALSGTSLVVSNGALLNFEKTKSHTIVVRVTDEGGIVFDKTFTIGVTDAPSRVLKGNSLANRLTSTSGEDRLHGGLGNDTLTGGAGEDIFVFDTPLNSRSNRDAITDFSVADDSIWLDNKIFAKFGSAGSLTNPAPLKSAYFKVADKAKDSNDYVIYDKIKGKLFYDADGSGTRYAAVEIATLSKNLALKSTDFFVV